MIPPSISASTTSTAEQPTLSAIQTVPEPSAVFQGLVAVMLAAAYLANRRRMRPDAQARSTSPARYDGIEALSPASQPVLQAAWKL
ncbi:hypothetical protein [Paludisphaera borealis]|uniref:hypothetical protein n=1 Tax=Paludisphaera borealis TaxID=1387353 RepID=UPI00097081C0|nr:hypothetical protein [Paludisphaera borealis]